jgi:hypothetical protein
MSKMKCVDVMHLAYLQTYENLFCLSKLIDLDGKSTVTLKNINDQFIIEDEVLFAGDSEQYFDMILLADNFYRYLEVKFEIPIKEKNKLKLLEFANELNLTGTSASIALDQDEYKFLVQSRLNLLGYGLVQENNDEPDNHHGFFYAVETTREQILATAKMASSVVRGLENSDWLASSS